MSINNIVTVMLDNITYQKNLLLLMEKELEALPEGTVYHKRIRGTSRFYYNPSLQSSDTGKQKYLGRNCHALKESLIRKKFLAKALPLLRSNLSAGAEFLRNYHPYSPEEIANSLWHGFSIHDFPTLSGWFDPQPEHEWVDDACEQSRLYPQQLIYCSPNGVRVRSKSESIIAGLLEANSIPYKYEMRLTLEDQTFYPDFTILNPLDRQIVYWEHFGMVDNPEYEAAMQRKLAEYRAHGIMPWDNLITTYETSSNPFNAQKILRIIKAFLMAE